MSKWLGIDYGSKRIGVAVGDSLSGIATPLEIISAKVEHLVFQRITELAREYSVDGLVVGWALNMDGSEGPQGKVTREAARKFAEATGLDVRIWDERLSSFAADEVLAGKFTRKKKRARQDAVAAAKILEDFLAASLKGFQKSSPGQSPGKRDSPKPKP